MLEESQLTEIRNHLLTKKLPIDILLEVQDHFITQILSIQQEEKLDFETAFVNVKENWRKELTLSWKGEMDLMDSTDFMRKMRKRIYWDNFILSLKYSFPYVMFLFFVPNVCNPTFFLIVFLSAILIPLCWGIFNYIIHFKDFKLAKKYQDNILTLHQDGIMIWLLIVPQFFNIIGFSTKEIFDFQKLFLFQNPFLENWKTLIVFTGILLVIGCIAYSIICQKNYLRQMKIVKPFLKYLEKTS